MALFQNIVVDGRAQAMVFFDVSGSTITNVFKGKHVIYAMASSMFVELKSYNVSGFKVVFYGSPNGSMTDGYIIDYSTYMTASPVEMFVEEAIAHATRYNLTCPHYAINGLLQEYKKSKLIMDWMNPKDDVRRMVFFVGDGELFDGESNKTTVKNAFKRSLDTFMSTFPHHHFVILTVDVSTTHSVGAETVIVGSDMYNACGNTKRITRFKTVTPLLPEGDVLFENAAVPITHIKFGNEMFLRSREPEFYEWVKTRSPEEHSAIIRHLCAALADYIEKEGMNDMMMDCFINSYKRLLPSELAEILQMQTQRVMSGTAALASEFRKSLSEKFASADESLVKDAQIAMGALPSTLYMTTVDRSTIYIARKRNVCHPYTKYAKGAIQVNGNMHPVIPMNRKKDDMNDQCLRQFLRGTMSKYGYEPRDEKTKWAVLCEMICVIYTPGVTEDMKTLWRKIGETMLQKKVAGKDITELEYFRQGNTLSSSLKAGLNTVATMFGLTSDSAWSGICKQMGILHGDDILWMNQKCIEFKEWSKLPPIKIIELEEELEWRCPITFASTISGGWTYPEHTWRGVPCEARFVVSNEGVDGMTVNGQVKCLICRTPVPREGMTFRIKADVPEASAPEASVPETTVGLPTPPNESNRCRAIQMVGVPGSGKSYYVKQLMELHRRSDWNLHVISVDEECLLLKQSGVGSRDLIGMAIGNVTSRVGRIKTMPGNHLLVVDTCGDFKDGKVFGHTMEKIVRLECNTCEDWDAYFGGTLYEVLTRDVSFMNVRNTGFQKCMDIHKKKSNALWGGRYKLKPPYTSVESAREYLRPFHEKWKMSWGMSLDATLLSVLA
jgi:hypothetical protein